MTRQSVPDRLTEHVVDEGLEMTAVLHGAVVRERRRGRGERAEGEPESPGHVHGLPPRADDDEMDVVVGDAEEGKVATGDASKGEDGPSPCILTREDGMAPFGRDGGMPEFRLVAPRENSHPAVGGVQEEGRSRGAFRCR